MQMFAILEVREALLKKVFWTIKRFLKAIPVGRVISLLETGSREGWEP